MRKTIVPSITAGSQKELDKKLAEACSFARTVQIDVRDGKFVPSKSLNFDFKIPKNRCKVEAKVLVEKPLEWVKKHGSKVNRMVIHIEACDEPRAVIKLAKEMGKEVGLAVSSKSPLSLIEDFLDDIHQVTVITSSTYKRGEKFVPETLEKVKSLRRVRSRLNIEVDGGMDPNTILLAAKAGANRFISGTYIEKARDKKKAYNELKSKVSLNIIPRF